MIDIRAAFISGIICFSVHEVGHLIAAKLFKQKLEKIVLMPFGAIFILKKTKCTSSMKDIILYSSGIILNLIVGISMYLLIKWLPSNIYLTYILYYNILIALLNLIPICSLDGSKIIKCVLDSVLKQDCSNIVCDISLVISIILVLFNIACMMAGIMIITPLVLGVFGIINTQIERKKSKIDLTRQGIVAINEDIILSDVIKRYGTTRNLLFRIINKRKSTIEILNYDELLCAYSMFGHDVSMRKIVLAKRERTLQE